jgi:acyl carrier protein
MNDAELRAVILAALGEIAPEAPLDQLAGDATLREELDLDSMDFLRFIQRLATATGVEVPESDYARLASLDACIAYLGARL